jgi:prolyl-tRNA synthetase
MKYSKLFGKTSKDVSKDILLTSHKLLVKAGFIRESVAGRYFILPLGQRVKDKIIQITREEMNNIGCQEMASPILHPLELWEETNRTASVNFELMKLADRRGADFALGGTAEEMFVDVVRKFQISYKELPFTIYQFSQKFRDEMRARGGLLRVREFTMKDAYSFDKDAAEFEKTYSDQSSAYSKIYSRVGLNAKPVAADGGYIGGDYCHEFIVDSDAGESKYLESEDGKYIAHEDIAEILLEKVNPDEQILDMQIIAQPEYVKTMEDNIKHYNKDSQYFLKNVVYRSDYGDIYIVTIRGDLEVNKTKLEKVLNLVGQIQEATDEDLKLIGSKSGYVHSWGHKFIDNIKTEGNIASRNRKVVYIADKSLYTVINFIGGQKTENTDSINVNYGRDFKHEIEADVSLAKAGHKALNGSVLVEKKGIEVGNIFQLGYHYTNLMKNSEYTDDSGNKQKYYMGCYGLGVERTLAAIAEVHNDDRGLIWPISVAPYRVHLIGLNLQDPKIFEVANKIYETMLANNIEVLFDERSNVSPGEKFADADLIGIPYRAVVSARTGDKIELKRRDSDEIKMVDLNELIDIIQ